MQNQLIDGYPAHISIRCGVSLFLYATSIFGPHPVIETTWAGADWPHP